MNSCSNLRGLGGCDDGIEAAARGLDVSKAGRLEKGGGPKTEPHYASTVAGLSWKGSGRGNVGEAG